MALFFGRPVFQSAPGFASFVPPPVGFVPAPDPTPPPLNRDGFLLGQRDVLRARALPARSLPVEPWIVNAGSDYWQGYVRGVESGGGLVAAVPGRVGLGVSIPSSFVVMFSSAIPGRRFFQEG